MTDILLALFCVVEGEATPFSVKVPSTDSVGDLKKAIKIEKANDFSDVDADKLKLWLVFIPVLPKKERKDIWLANVPSKEDLDETDIASVFAEAPLKKSIHVIVERPPPALAQSYTSPITFPYGECDNPCFSFFIHVCNIWSYMEIGNLKANIKRITEKFFAPGSDTTVFLDRFVQGLEKLPLTTGSIAGLPNVWLRKNPQVDTRPSLLFSNLPHPLSDTLYPTSDAILKHIKTYGPTSVPVFGGTGYGKTRGMIELLSRRWGFYFNASTSDLGSDDITTLINHVRSRLQEDLLANNRKARMATYWLLLSRLKILQYCLS
ncbi:hypothetical protein BG004_004382, partial [Podila humilis]